MAELQYEGGEKKRKAGKTRETPFNEHFSPEDANMLLSAIANVDKKAADVGLNKNVRNAVKTSNNYAVTSDEGFELTEYPSLLIINPDSNSTEASTLTIDELVQVALLRWDGTPIQANDLVTNKPVIALLDSDGNYRTYGVGAGATLPTTTFTASSATNLSLNPTKPYGNNYAWTIGADGELSYNNATVPDGAKGVLHVINSSGTVKKISLGVTVKTTLDALRLDNANGSGDLTISTIANNGSGLIRVTTSAAHSLTSGNIVKITGVKGTYEANETYEVIVIDSTIFDLKGSLFVNAYFSDGVARKQGYFLKNSLNINGTNVYEYVVRGANLYLTKAGEIYDI